jgi:hypothetical protein
VSDIHPPTHKQKEGSFHLFTHPTLRH